MNIRVRHSVITNRPFWRARHWTTPRVGACLVLAGLLGACGSGGSGASLESAEQAADASQHPATGAATPEGSALDEVEVGVIPIIDVAPIYLGREKGFFADNGIELTLSSGQGGAAIIPGVVSGQLAFGFSNMSSLLSAEAEGLPVRAIASGLYALGTGKGETDYGALVAVGDSEIHSAADLEGKKVGVNALSGIAEVVVRESVRKDGGDPDAVNYLEIAFPDMPGALDAERIDAAWVLEPFLTIVQNQGQRVIAWSFEDTAPNLMISAYFTSDALTERDPDLVQRFTDAINMSMDYAAENEQEVREILATYTEIPDAVAAEVTLPRWTSDVELESVNALANAARRYGFITAEPDVGRLMP